MLLYMDFINKILENNNTLKIRAVDIIINKYFLAKYLV